MVARDTLDSKSVDAGMAVRAREALASRERLLELLSNADRLQEEAARLQARADESVKSQIKKLKDESEALKDIAEREKAVKQLPEYQAADQAFKNAKEELGLNELAQERKSVQAELKAQAEDAPDVIALIQQAEELTAQAEQAVAEAGSLQPVSDAEFHAIISQVAQG